MPKPVARQRLYESGPSAKGNPWRGVAHQPPAREFQYVHGAVSPREGGLDWMICSAMNTENRGVFLAQVSAAHPHEFIVMILDGASSHVAKALAVPENIRLQPAACLFARTQSSGTPLG